MSREMKRNRRRERRGNERREMRRRRRGHLLVCVIIDGHVEGPGGAADHPRAAVRVLFRLVHVLGGTLFIHFYNYF